MAARGEEPPEAHIHCPQLGMLTVTVVNHFEAAMAGTDSDGLSGVVAWRYTPAHPAWLAHVLGVALTGAAVFGDRKPLIIHPSHAQKKKR